MLVNEGTLCFLYIRSKISYQQVEFRILVFKVITVVARDQDELFELNAI